MIGSVRQAMLTGRHFGKLKELDWPQNMSPLDNHTNKKEKKGTKDG